ncbi:MAG: hypothetical protein GYA21_02980 [Myxococcales bacterium]|nr:hypothetical protein [Myxococcales bacterium]
MGTSMRANLSWRLLALSVAWLPGCENGPRWTPRPAAVRPAAVGVGSDRWLLIDGQEFMPSAAWSASGGVALDARFQVQLNGSAASSVRWLGPERMLARLALPGEWSTGTLDLEVIGPNGRVGGLARAACAGPAEPWLLHCCMAEATERIDLCATPPGGSQPSRRVASDLFLPNVGNKGLFLVSPDQRWLAFLRRSVEQGWLALVLVDRLRGFEVEMDRLAISAPADNPAWDSRLLDWTFSPDGSWLAWVVERRLLKVARLPASPEEPVSVRVLVDDTNGAPGGIDSPDIDPASRRVLFTRWAEAPGRSFNPPRALYLVPLEGGAPLPLIEGEDEGAGTNNGPGAFLPGGEGVLFLSERLRLRMPFINTDGNGQQQVVMVNANLPHRLVWPEGSVSGVTDPIYAYFSLTRPVISPDGRFAAFVGQAYDEIAASGKSFVDVFLVDLSQAPAEPVRALPDHIACAALGTCANGTVLDVYDLAPAFSPDSRWLTADALFSIGDTWVDCSYRVPVDRPTDVDLLCLDERFGLMAWNPRAVERLDCPDTVDWLALPEFVR